MTSGGKQQVAPFSFHCRICYERLNLTDRPPVVLPCGHTYICQVCSLKLTRCMECRTRIVPVKQRPPPQTTQAAARGGSGGHSYRHRHQQQRHEQYQYPVPTTVDELHSVCKATAQDDSRPPLPKNVVLMSLMEAAEQKMGARADSDEDDAYESGDDDALVLEGLRALSSSYGTYVVKAKEGLWVYDNKPSASTPPPPTPQPSQLQLATVVLPPSAATAAAKPLSRSNSTSSADPPGKSPTKENDDPAHTRRCSSRSREDKREQRRNSNKSKSPVPHVVIDSDSSLNLSTASLGNTVKQLASSSASKQRVPKLKKPAKPVERLMHGQTVQVVLVKDSIAQMARGGGFIRMEHDDQLVKVGEPTDEACRIEGIIFSILEEKKQYKSRIHNLSKLEKSMQSALRKFYIIEAQELEEKRAKAKLDQLEREGSSAQNTSVALSLLEEEDDTFPLDEGFEQTNQYGIVTPPSSPQMLEMSPSSDIATPASPRTTRRHQAAAAAAAAVNPQAPPAYHYEMGTTGTHSSSSSGVASLSRPQAKNNATSASAKKELTWEEEMFQQGCDFLFCAMPLCASSSAVNDASGSLGPALQPTSSILTGQGSPYIGGHYTGYAYNHNQSPHRHYIPRSDSYDGNGSTLSSGSTVASGAVDFSTGLSGHTGISRGTAKRRHTPRKKEVRYMSNHDGVAHIRRQRNDSKHSGGASVISMGGCSKASIATL